jgi:hypothetical protein
MNAEMTYGTYVPAIQRACPFCGNNNLMMRFDGLTQGYIMCMVATCSARGPNVSRFMGARFNVGISDVFVTDNALAQEAWEKWNDRRCHG